MNKETFVKMEKGGLYERGILNLIFPDNEDEN